jgi:glucose-1-phosphatase
MVDLKGIKNIIFDYGGVIINIDLQLSIAAFKKLGFSNVEEILFQLNSSKLLLMMEKGQISPEGFYQEIRKSSGLTLSDKEIETAWNTLLLDMPAKRIRLLEKLKIHHRIFLLSNTNKIHFHHFAKQLKDKFGYSNFDELFEKAWFSFDLNMNKPNPEIFQYALNDARLIPDETLFIDDTKINTDAALKVGMKVHHLEPGEEITELLGVDWHPS